MIIVGILKDRKWIEKDREKQGLPPLCFIFWDSAKQGTFKYKKKRERMSKKERKRRKMALKEE